jgi:hypothetical protein
VAWWAGAGRATCAESVVCGGAAAARSVVGGAGAAGARSVVGGGGPAGAPCAVCGGVLPGATVGGGFVGGAEATVGGGFVGGAEATVGGGFVGGAGFVGCEVLSGDRWFAGLESGSCEPRSVGAGSGTGCDEVAGGVTAVVPPVAAGCVTSGPGWSAATVGVALAGSGLLPAGMPFVVDGLMSTARAPRAAGATVAATTQAHTRTRTAISRAGQGPKAERAPMGENPLERRHRTVADVSKRGPSQRAGGAGSAAKWSQRPADISVARLVCHTALSAEKQPA